MSQIDDYARGHRDAARLAVAWLHAQADLMNDPKAQLILNNAGHGLGVAFARCRAQGEYPKKLKNLTGGST